jgi:glyoxylase-like metal-dependent hydrolase (beta-lactamase superfamily II)
VKKIEPDLYSFTGLVLGRVYLVIDPDGLTIIDAGLWFAPGQIVEQLRAAGYKRGDVKRILVTHAHPDHVIGLPRLQQMTGAQVIVSAVERPVVEGKTPVLSSPIDKITNLAGLRSPFRIMLKGTCVNHEVMDGDILDEVMGGLRVIATPGHTPGHVSFWQPERRILFCGDVISNGAGMRLPSPAWTVDMEENKRSIQHVAALEPSLVCFGHGDPLRQDAAQAIRSFAKQAAPEHMDKGRVK